MESIREITASDTLNVRHQAMWPDKPASFVQVDGDETGVHFGLFSGDTLVSVISLFRVRNEVQFRKFATLPAFQGQGFGTKLIQYILQETSTWNIDRLWCNARVDKVAFYRKFGLVEIGTAFLRDGLWYVRMERMELNRSRS